MLKKALIGCLALLVCFSVGYGQQVKWKDGFLTLDAKPAGNRSSEICGGVSCAASKEIWPQSA